MQYMAIVAGIGCAKISQECAVITFPHVCSHSSACRAVESIVKKHPEHVNVREQLACTPLHLAASEGELEVARTLLKIVCTIQSLVCNASRMCIHISYVLRVWQYRIYEPSDPGL